MSWIVALHGAFDDALHDALEDAIGVPDADRPGLLGGKGANLAVMAHELGLRVPPAVVVTTEACRAYLHDGWPEGLDDELRSAVTGLEVATGRTFGAGPRPLLVSVRSGAAVSMPGMMDTVLNLGMTPAVEQALAREFADEAFAADCSRRFRLQYRDVVGTDAPDDPHRQLREAVAAVFESWRSPRARRFRDHEGIDHDLGTAVVVQAMVFGNLDDRSGTGVVFTRDPATGERRPFGDYLPRAQGEDVVGGAHAVAGLDLLAAELPDVHAELLAALDRLERHYRDLCDVEFTVSAATLYFLQTRIGRRSPLAEARIAVDMGLDDEFPLTRAEAVARVRPDTLHRLVSAVGVDHAAVAAATGLAASPGVGCGVLCRDPDEAEALAEQGTDVVLVREDTSPADVHGMVAASAIVTVRGGLASHAAVVARSWGIPAVTGAAEVELVEGGVRCGEVVVPDGSVLTVDGSTGAIHVGDVRARGHVADGAHEAQLIRQWAAELGVEPGATGPPNEPDALDEHDGHDGRAVDTDEPATPLAVTPLAVLRLVGLKGLCAVETVAAALGVQPEHVAAVLEEHDALVAHSSRGVRLGPEGRAWVVAELDRERSNVPAHALADIHERFAELDPLCKAAVTEWQLGAQTDADLEATAAALGAVDARVQPLVAEVAAVVPRLTPYGRRLARALEAVAGGDRSMIASPLADSYHTVWFELHEELIALAGRSRSDEVS